MKSSTVEPCNKRLVVFADNAITIAELFIKENTRKTINYRDVVLLSRGRDSPSMEF